MSSIFMSIAVLMVAIAVTLLIYPLLIHHRHAGAKALFFAVLVPLLGPALYVYVGSPAAAVTGQSRPYSAQGRLVTSSAPKRAEMLGSVASLVDGLASRLENDPTNAKGWMLLARSYEHLGRLRQAAEAYGRAKSIGTSDERLEALLLAGAHDNPTRAEIRGRVSLASGTSSTVAESDSVFIFAKALQGSTIPLAVIKRPAADLPFDFVLSDDNSMVKGASLADVDEVVITARISSSGNVLETGSGLEVTSGSVPVGSAEPIHLELTGGASDAAMQTAENQ